MLRKTPLQWIEVQRHPRASMRPQRNAAENQALLSAIDSVQSASMRPQRNAAENVAVSEGGHRLRRLQ